MAVQRTAGLAFREILQIYFHVIHVIFICYLFFRRKILRKHTKIVIRTLYVLESLRITSSIG